MVKTYISLDSGQTIKAIILRFTYMYILQYIDMTFLDFREYWIMFFTMLNKSRPLCMRSIISIKVLSCITHDGGDNAQTVAWMRPRI